jgi:hypothetical protein
MSKLAVENLSQIYIRNTLEVLKYDTGEGLRTSVGHQ